MEKVRGDGALRAREDGLTEQAEQAVPHRVRPVTHNMTRFSQRTLAAEAEDLAEELKLVEQFHQHPDDACPLKNPVLVIEGEKIDMQRADGRLACPWASCRYHLALDIDPDNGSIKENFPDMSPDEIPFPCFLEAMMTQGPMVLEEVGKLTNLTRERVRQRTDMSLVKLRNRRELTPWKGHAKDLTNRNDDGPTYPKSLP
jgi:hypothetical protein